MSRLPPVPREELNPEQQEFHDHFHEVVSQKGPPGASEKAGKTLLPFLVVLPKTGRRNVDMMGVLEDETEDLPNDAKETANLVCTAHFRCAFVTQAHKMLAIKLTSVTQKQAESIIAGAKPPDLNENCSIAYDTAYALVVVRGPLPQELWNRCLEAFGREGTVGLVHYVSLIAWTCMGLNACDVPAPEGAPGQG